MGLRLVARGSLLRFETVQRFVHRVLKVGPALDVVVTCTGYRAIKDELLYGMSQGRGSFAWNDLILPGSNDCYRDVALLQRSCSIDFVTKEWADGNPRVQVFS